MDKSIISAAQQGDQKAFKQIYQQYKRYWFAICLRYQSDKSDAEDVLQNGLVKIFTKISQFRNDKGSFKDWSAKVMVNENLIYIRRKKPVEPLEDHTTNLPYVGHVLDSDDPSPELLMQIVQSLPPGYREVFNLYVIEGYQHAEIAEILDITVGASKSQLFKAKKMIKQRVSERIQLKAV